MRKFMLVIAMISSSFSLYSQVIKGIILDQDSKEPVISAAIYFNGTSAGTLSDLNGNFSIDISKYSSMPLTISAIGYYSSTLKDFAGKKQLQVLLRPKTFELTEVEVKAKSFAAKRKQNLIIFRDVFLGNNVNASKCRIINENDIRFRYSDSEDTIIAYALKPIIIENNSLGYILTYYLDQFQYDRRHRLFLFSGDLIFKEDSMADMNQKFAYNFERSEAYHGSRMHFFRALWMNQLEDEGFKIMNPEGRTLRYSDIVREAGNRRKFLSYPDRLKISYKADMVYSYIVFTGGNVFFDPSGYYDATKIIWEGKMSSQRIADQLPFEYLP